MPGNGPEFWRMTARYSANPYELPIGTAALPLGAPSYAVTAGSPRGAGASGIDSLAYAVAVLWQDSSSTSHFLRRSFTMFYQLFRSPTASGRRPRPMHRLRQQPRLEQLEDRCMLSANVVLEWNAIALDALKNDSMLGANSKQNAPIRASRALAIVQAA